MTRENSIDSSLTASSCRFATEKSGLKIRFTLPGLPNLALDIYGCLKGALIIAPLGLRLVKIFELISD